MQDWKEHSSDTKTEEEHEQEEDYWNTWRNDNEEIDEFGTPRHWANGGW